MPAGRPSVRAEELMEEICVRLSEGETLARICDDNHMPSRRTIHSWAINDSDFFTRIAYARELGQEFTVDECRMIADTATPEDVNVAKLRIWHRQWEASKRAPKRFGDKIQQEHTGSVGVQLVHSIPRPDREEK